MKKTIAVALAALLMISLLLTACGGGSSTPVGKWGLYSVSVNGETYAKGDETFDLLFGDDSDDMFYFEFKQDGTFTATFFGESVDGTWTQNGTVVAADVDGEVQNFELKGDKMAATTEGTEVVMYKK